MTANSSAITTRVIDEISAADVPSGTTLYLFGSHFRRSGDGSDVDVLLIYPQGELRWAHALAELMRESAEDAVVDVLALSDAEERELGFIESEQAHQIWP
jgi:predicted nucleotidyltransferase